MLHHYYFQVAGKPHTNIYKLNMMKKKATPQMKMATFKNGTTMSLRRKIRQNEEDTKSL